MAKRSKPEIVDVEALRAALAAAEARADHAEAEAAAVKAQLSGDAALIAHLRLEIARLNRTLYGQRSERTQRLLDQYELQLEELEASAAADALTAEKAAAKAAVPAPAERRKPSRQPFPPTCRACASWCRPRPPAVLRGHAPVEAGRGRH